MQVKEKGRREIEEKLKSMGDYVKMGYLSQCLKQNIDLDTRKFVLLHLSTLYESRKMYLDAGKLMQNAANINTSTQGKIADLLKACELFTKNGNHELADELFHKAMNHAEFSGMKDEIKKKQINMYMNQAKSYMSEDKRAYAMKFFERLLMLNLSGEEKTYVQTSLLELYKKLGKIREYSQLKYSM